MLDIQGLHIRAALFRYIREFFVERGFLEVDTPIRQPVIIPECNIVPISADGQYLQTSPELCMKRLLAAGCDKIFQICPCFRKDELGSRHLEEFTMLEWYRTGADYHQLMADCAELLQYVVPKVLDISNREQSLYRESAKTHVLVERPEKMTVEDSFLHYSPIPLQQAIAEETFDEVLVEHIEPNLGTNRPLFLIDYPRELASLAKVSEKNSDVAERFELYVSGIELANGFSELTDSLEQRQRFQKEIEAIELGQGRSPEMPEQFLKDLCLLEKAAGIAFGFDRFLMLIRKENTINSVVSFTQQDY
jgi:lysyl-tRNA synthetase class 2